MNKFQKISFGGFLITAILLISSGAVFLFADQIMPYHETAIGIKWGEMSDGLQVMTLNYMKSAGVGFLTTGIAIICLLLFYFRKGDRRASLVITIIALTELLLMTYRSYEVMIKTPADPPISLTIIATVIVLISFILSLNKAKINKA